MLVPSLLLALTFTSLAASAAPTQATLSPGLFERVSSGVAYVTGSTCSGQRVSQGSGFLIGRSVVMTARHVVRGACRINVKVASRKHRVTAWTYWRGSARSDGEAEDLATLKLAGESEGYQFSIRSGTPPPGTNLAMVGHPLGNRVSLNQGKIISKFRIGGVPVIAVQMLGAEGASGSAFVDDAGRVVGVLQVGLGGADFLGQRTAGVLVGIDLSRVSSRIRPALCRAYPNGGIRGCAPRKSPKNPPLPTPPPVAPGPLRISECWIASSESWEPTAKVFSLSPVVQSVYAVLRLNRSARAEEALSLVVRLARPDGTLYVDSPYEETGQPFITWKVKIDLRGRGQSAPMAGDWVLSMGLGETQPCSFGVRVERGTPMSLSVTSTSFDPYYTYGIYVSWALLQDYETGAQFSARLVMPNGTVTSTSPIYVSDYSTSGSEYLSLPYCFRSTYSGSDSCVYGTYRVELLKGSEVIASLPIEGRK